MIKKKKKEPKAAPIMNEPNPEPNNGSGPYSPQSLHSVGITIQSDMELFLSVESDKNSEVFVFDLSWKPRAVFERIEYTKELVFPERVVSAVGILPLQVT